MNPIEDRTKNATRSHRKGVRDKKKVYALVLHQTAFSRGNDSTKYDNIPVHFVVLPNGKIVQLHPITAYLWSSNGFNPGSVAVEFVGNFPNTRGQCWESKKYGCHQLTPAQIAAGRALVDHLNKEIKLTHILAHRQSSGKRENDPGPDIWYHVGQWAVDNRGLKDGGAGFKVDTGLAIPEVWRSWGKTRPLQQEEGEEQEYEFRQRRPPVRRRPASRAKLRPPFGLPRRRRPGVIPDFPYPYPVPYPSFEPPPPPPESGGGGMPEPDEPEPGPPTDTEFEEEANRFSPDYSRWIQSSLNKIMGLRLAVDGVVGPQTRSAIRSFQQKYGLTADGIVGPQTEGALIRAGAGNPPQGAGTTPTPTPSTGTPDIVTVSGIQVARSIAPNVQGLLNAASAAGIRLSGGGYRSTAQQIALRKKHCGPTEYDIYKKPSSQCTPPTAPPGLSNHEKGLAIDFTYNGRGMDSQDNPGFQWLAVNAARYGLKNFAKEPWHWSVDGR